VVTEIQVNANANATEQNRTERVADVSAALVLLSFGCVHYGEWLVVLLLPVNGKEASKQATEQSGVAKSKSLL